MKLPFVTALLAIAAITSVPSFGAQNHHVKRHKVRKHKRVKHTS